MGTIFPECCVKAVARKSRRGAVLPPGTAEGGEKGQVLGPGRLHPWANSRHKTQVPPVC